MVKLQSADKAPGYCTSGPGAGLLRFKAISGLFVSDYDVRGVHRRVLARILT